MMLEPESIFTNCATFEPGGDFEAFLRVVPARWVVYLLADADDRPVQLLCVKNLRYSLKRRLGPGEPAAGLSKRVNSRDLVRRVHWRRVDSTPEADWLYYEAARALFPQSYQGMTGFRPAWFVHVNPNASFPRYTKTIDLTTRAGLLMGPVEDKHAAARLIELAEDAFDLCRYYNILVEAPHGKACAYKEMGKCPAPCDGSISLEQYRGLVQWSADTLIDPEPFVRDQSGRMRSAAEEYHFEAAAKIKAFVDSIGKLGKGPFRHVRLLKDFTFLSLQHGPREGTAKVFLVTPGWIEQVVSLIAEPANPAELLGHVLALAAPRIGAAIDEIGAERIGIVAHHLFSTKNVPGGQGVFLPIGLLEERSFLKAFRDLKKQKVLDEEIDAEGVTKELQALPAVL
jgi:excinuclease UvrABC nuclease subunit